MRSALAAALACVACGDLPPLGQALLRLDTDAPLPPPGEQLAEGEPPALFDRLRLEVFEPGAAAPCTGCSRDVAVDRALFAEGRASFGVVYPPDASGFRARVRLYLTHTLRDSEPPADAVLELWLALPALAAEGVVERSAFLATDSLGVPRGSPEQPLEPDEAPPGPSQVGSWPPAQPRACAGEPRAGEVCVPGGAFWMGDRSLRQLDLGELRLVAMAPFYLEAREVTVGALRERHGDAIPEGVTLWSGTVDGNGLDDGCTYTNSGVHDQLPVTCVSWAAARAECAARGGDLPTEAALEYAAGAGAGQPHPWGTDDAACADAIFARGGPLELAGEAAGPCLPLEAAFGPVTAGSGARDRLRLPGGEILDLAGNVAEWARDRGAGEGDDCWPTGILVDPLCAGADDEARRTVKGGSYVVSDQRELRAAHKRLAAAAGDPATGLRCARE